MKTDVLIKQLLIEFELINRPVHQNELIYTKECEYNIKRLTEFAEAYHDARCAESEPIHNQLCGCGKPVRYSTHSGMACNKIARCSTREELESKVIELTLQGTKAESEPVAYRQTIHGEHKGKVNIQYGYSEIQIMVSDTPLYAKP